MGKGKSRRKGETEGASLSIPAIEPGTIMLIRGASGAGKSSLMRALRKGVLSRRRRARGGDGTRGGATVSTPSLCPGVGESFSARGCVDSCGVIWIDLGALALPRVPLVDCFGDQLSLREALSLLSRVGLSEAWSYLRLPGELSEGQRWRLRVALGIYRAREAMRAGHSVVIACDEFTSLLDRITGAIVARCLRRSIDEMNGAGLVNPGSRIEMETDPGRRFGSEPGVGAPLARGHEDKAPWVSGVLATAHDDLVVPLRADVVVTCDFGRVRVDDTVTR